jgi:glycolate oxidase FAD binding subunit
MVIDHRAGDLTCTVSADVPLMELQGVLARGGQMLALDPPGDSALTVGEVFDRALFGPRAHRYGPPRDLVLGIRARLPGGEEVRGGGRVVKNVAGYDLPKLFTGAEGRLGEILELILRLHPVPAETCTLVAPLADSLPLEPLCPACVEVQWPQERMLARFESPVADALARAAQRLLGGELVRDDEALWDEHRARQFGLHLHRCLPAEVSAEVARLRGDGAATVVGRWARGWLFADVPAKERPLSDLERRIVDRFAA